MVLRKHNTLLGLSNLKTKEVLETAKIFELKLGVQKLFEFSNGCR